MVPGEATSQILSTKASIGVRRDYVEDEADVELEVDGLQTLFRFETCTDELSNTIRN